MWDTTSNPAQIMIVQKKKNLVLSVCPGQYKTTSSKRGQLFDIAIVHPDSVENHDKFKQTITVLQLVF